MTDKEKQLGVWLSQIADELNITETMLNKAISSYEAVGKWLSDGIPLDVKIEPQGSLGLGTATRPVSDNHEYDIDLVCLLKNGSTLPPEQIKRLVGDRLKATALTEIWLKKKENDAGPCSMMSFTWISYLVFPRIYTMWNLIGQLSG